MVDHDLEVLPDPAAVAARAAGYVAEVARATVAALPARFDLVHLGLGPDGHTASLVPGGRVLDETSALVALTLRYQGHRRMTLTYPALARADRILRLVTGADKQEPLATLLSGDRSIPAGRVQAGHSLVLADAQAAGQVRNAAPAHRDGDHR